MTLVRRALLVSALLAYAAFQRTLASTQSPSVSTDSPAYVAGELVTATGRDFVPGEIVTLQVTHVDGTAESGMGHEPTTVIVGSDGNFQFTWTPNAADIAGPQLLVTLSGMGIDFAIESARLAARTLQGSSRERGLREYQGAVANSGS